MIRPKFKVVGTLTELFSSNSRIFINYIIIIKEHSSLSVFCGASCAGQRSHNSKKKIKR